MSFLTTNWPVIVSILFGLSEVLAQIPSIKANSIFQLVAGLFKSLKDAQDAKVAVPTDVEAPKDQPKK